MPQAHQQSEGKRFALEKGELLTVLEPFDLPGHPHQAGAQSLVSDSHRDHGVRGTVLSVEEDPSRGSGDLTSAM